MANSAMRRTGTQTPRPGSAARARIRASVDKVAREYGIPAVVGTGVATTTIRDGQTIEVDGDAGRVHLID